MRRISLLINFGTELFKGGVSRVVNKLTDHEKSESRQDAKKRKLSLTLLSASFASLCETFHRFKIDCQP